MVQVVVILSSDRINLTYAAATIRLDAGCGARRDSPRTLTRRLGQAASQRLVPLSQVAITLSDFLNLESQLLSKRRDLHPKKIDSSKRLASEIDSSKSALAQRRYKTEGPSRVSTYVSEDSKE